MYGNQKEENIRLDQEGSIPNGKPIEPKSRKIGKPGFLKWLFFLLIILYILISYFHAPILTRLGRYLVVEHPPQRSDVIVCLGGGNVERGLAAADAYRKGLAPRILMAREAFPDGYELLQKKGINYPQSVDLLIMVLKGLGLPRSALITSDRQAENTFEEAKIISDLVKEGGYRSIILVTSPTHSRRTWLTFRKVFEGEEVRILVLASPYSRFSPEDWWKNRRYVQEVIVEYEKLIYYTLKYFI